MTAPIEHVEDAHKLTADSIVELFHLILKDGSHLYLKPNNDLTWQGHDWEGIGIKMGGVSNSADAQEVSRPQLIIANPSGVFSSFVVSGKLNRATVMRLRVLGAHILSDQAIYTQTTWTVMKPTGLNKTLITLELRGQMDGPNFLTPARVFMPPEFPMVSL